MFRIFSIVAFWIIGIFLISIIGSSTFPQVSNSGLGSQSETQDFNYYFSLAQWDGGNYIEIAKNGYPDSKYFAFSPLYPIFIRLIHSVFNLDFVISGLIISIVSFLIFLFFFHKYTALIYGKKHADTTVLTFLFFPTTFFCLLVYSESLFLLLVMLSIFAMYKRNIIAYSMSTALLPLARFVGIFLLLGNIFKAILNNRSKSLLVISFLSLTPFLAYLISIHIILGNVFAFSSVQSLWGRYTLDPITTIISNVVSLISLQSFSLNNFFDLFITLLFLYLLITNIKRLHSNIWIFSILTILTPVSTGTLISIPRYVLPSLGAFIVIGIMLNNYPRLKIFIWASSLALQCLFVSLFINGYWVA
ncbi:MAG: hypothetical protein UU23_C0003G0039 [Candidatus Curtissbacteria bacterium GW2011_GWA1_40_9]|uniref:Integral membrane protein n=1 Tax=Candidatus Curtissbacteria bacterium GW2011_GWA1_40_9 TaxID=1618408 RepID=A0A0G0TTH5_9BACT|nr:MAG: hypothetical protein UU23_C0003G0039 [Candidatus Curtissbacteria bacterium GW2011_GWA1_40_9]